MEWLTSLWEKNRILFWILLPLVILAFVVKLFLDSNYEGAIDDVNTVQQNDNELGKEQANTNSAADVHKENADRIEGKINLNNNSEGDEKWHLKK
jgi:hypothetical protein